MTVHNLQRMQGDAKISCDLCVIGAGAAGISLAREFLGHRARVVVLESGDLWFRHKPQFLYIGENSGIDNYPASHSRFRMFGGSTTRWGGQCRPLRPLDFERRSEIPHSGWPFGYEHLEPYYRRAQEVCNLGPFDYLPGSWLPQHDNPLLFDSASLDTIIYQFSYPSDFGQVYYQDLASAPNLDIYLNANVTDITAGADGGTLSGVRATSFNNKRVNVTARYYVLACGGIENPRLLLNCDRVAPRGLGNDHDLVGRYFMDHPYFMTGYFEPRNPRLEQNCHTIYDYEKVGVEQKFHAAFSLKEDVLRERGVNGAGLYFVRRPLYKTLAEYYTPAGKSFTHLVNILRHDDVPNRKFMAHVRNVLRGFDTVMVTLGRQALHQVRPRQVLGLRSVLESTPNPESRVMLTEKRDHFGMRRVRVDWRMNATDSAGFDCLMKTLSTEFRRLGLGRMVEDPSVDADHLPNSLTGGKHHMGTTRMHASPSQGVVDEYCRVHSVANLYIAGSSVFPTCGFVNPTLTIVALAIRLADHIKAQLKSVRHPLSQ